MKLLLTSAGITNQSIADSLTMLVGKPPAATKVVVIPTAENVEAGNKDWFIGQFTNLRKFGFTWIDIVDPSADGINWRSRLTEVDVVFVSGGNTFHLLNQVRKTGFGDWLKDAIDFKVYVGASAGSIIMTPSIAIASVDDGDENLIGLKDLTGLRFVDFEVSPHTPEWVSYKANEEYAKSITNKLYAIDDETAIKIVYEAVEVISEGKWRELR
ncbi:MAG: Type 1 glutamine amidotransferase-like domain-containing protein [Candidatus Saccharimonadia bacterium]